MSDKPDLTLDQPAQAGWLRAEFYGDAEAAKGYLFEARRQLGAMRARYGVNARIANGEPGGYFRDFRILPDGTQIDVLTNDGHDTVRITAPPPPVSEQPTPEYTPPEPPTAEGASTSSEVTPDVPEPHEEPLEMPPKKVQLDDYAVCGYSFDADYNSFLFHWTPSDGFTDIPFFADNYYGYTTRMSRDGEVVCGYMGDDNGLQAFYWSKKTGSLPLGVESDSLATGVSADGTVFCGYGDAEIGPGNYAQRAYRWEVTSTNPTPVMTVLELPADVIETRDGAISGDGSTIVGTVRMGNGMGAYGYRAVLWAADNTLTLLPLSGIVATETETLQYIQNWTQYDSSGTAFHSFTETYTPGTLGVAGQPGTPGTIVYSDGSATQPNSEDYPVYPYTTTDHAITGGGPTSYGSDAMTGTERIYTYDVPADMFATGISDNGAVVCGTVRPPTTTNTAPAQMFRWTATDGVQLLGPGEAHGISEDGQTIVGHRQDDSGYTWIMWTQATGIVDVGPGQANAISSAEFSDGTPTPLGTLMAGRSGATDDPGYMAVVRTPPDIYGNYTETQLGYGRGGVSSIATDITITTEEYDL